MDSLKRTIKFGEPIIGEEEIQDVIKVLQSGWLTHGPKTEEFEKVFSEYIGTKYAVAVSSCTAALHLSLMALGVGTGDEVIVPAQTHVATAHSAEFVGAQPVFADVDITSGTITTETIKAKLTKNTKAVNVVHFAGQPCEMDEIRNLCENKGIFIVEDCAHSLGSVYKGKKTGNIGNTGCYSFYPIKQITTCEGGMLTTNDQRIAMLASKQRGFGIDKAVQERKIAGYYDVPYLGYNYRMTEVEAAIGIIQMKKLPAMNNSRIENAKYLISLIKNIPGISFIKESKDIVNTHFFFQLKLERGYPTRRNDLAKKFTERGIGTSIYYATPLHLMTYYRQKYGYKKGDLVNAELIADTTIALPIGPRVLKEDLELMAQIISENSK